MKKILLLGCLVISINFLYSSELSTKVYATVCSANQTVGPNGLCSDKIEIPKCPDGSANINGCNNPRLQVDNGVNTQQMNDSIAKANCGDIEGTTPEDSTKDASCNKFSCESLFTKHEDARICNRNRCIINKGLQNDKGKEVGDNPCNCKYGFEGKGVTGIPLNTSIPFIGRCVSKSSGAEGDDSSLNAFPVIITAATKMLVTVILLVSFVMIVVGGVEWASGDAKSGKAKITKVAIGIAMLGMMGAILRLINPNFFK